MARAALRWDIQDLAKQAGVGRATVSRFEVEQVEPNLATKTVIRQALERAGVEFHPNGSVGLREAADVAQP
jgi:DNA-binding XRE family transcriptional regulator